ncbi:Cytochrome P450 709B2 [Dichanthelium oligosanthes]|uniref:Cytochrome P450 709B2 n=1 Tax=Dichanthelium oligosanthes TaxID=888268 RepID=A0A1E5VYX5_9POAL|nr:Cytochrome P450 709B2 [Dichanthelium oligosanthes]
MAAVPLLASAAALLALAAAAWLWDYAVVRLLWRPRAVAAAFRARGVRGPPYRFLSGCNGDMRRMKAEADGATMDVRDHDYLRRVIPHFLAWKEQYLPTKSNRLKWMLEKKLKTALTAIIQLRLASKGSGYGDDLLGAMLEACCMTEQGEKQDELTLAMDEIIDECKTFFFAGHETTSHLLTWTMFLLSVHPEWQERLREEVLRECGKANPTADTLSKLKEMTMVLLETLRLYGPVMIMLRKPISDIRLGNLSIPKATGIVIPIPILHRDKEVWGDNANEFDPLRFENGITNAAKTPQALLSFSIGPRSCIGQNFAMLEAKSVMAMILQKFSFTLSPKYLPTASNRQKWKLERKLRDTLVQIIQSRLGPEGSLYGNDLFGLMLRACIPTEQGGKQQQLSLSMDETIHGCKTFFFAGHETTALLLTWTVFLLSVYPEWQERLRKEMTMVLLETLRLYSPAVFTQRKAMTDMAVGEIKIRQGFGIVIPFAIMHRDKKIWGDDADEFNPLRFQNGVTKAAKVPHALLAFSVGPRSCTGQNFAMMEAKSVMAMILQKFSFTLSPDYVHAPVDLLTLQPKFGLPVVLKLLVECT